MEKEPPTWLNKDFLTSALQGGENCKPNIEILNFSLKLAVAPGNNYTSVIYRVNIHYKHKGNLENIIEASLIVKAPLEKGVFSDFTDKADMFSTEPKVYRLLPRLTEKVKYEFAPKHYFSAVKNSLTLQDLKPEGYIVCDKFKQLDIIHCKKLICSLAKFHAASVASHHESPDLMGTFCERYYKEEGPVVEEMKVWVISAMKLFIDMLAKENYQSLALYVSDRLDKVWKSIAKICSRRENSLNVLNHGDCWTNNLLFKYNDSGDIIDVKFIDFQVVRYSSPVSDLLYFIWSSGDENVRDNHQQELYNTYLQTLNSTLEELNCQERLTHEELTANLKSAFDWILYTIGFILPMTMCDTDKVVDFDTLDFGDMKRDGMGDRYSTMYNSRRYQQLLPGYLRQIEKVINC